MVKSGPPSLIRNEDYEAIQSAVMETSRGRWFLAEYAKQNRTADTEMLLGAIQKLHDSLVQQDKTTDTARIKHELMDIAGAIANTKQEIAAMNAGDGADGIATASIELDAIVTSAEKATGDILNHAEHIQEIAWTLRENGIDENSCASLDNHATEIYTACSFQDLTGQRTQKIIQILAFIDQRIEAMTDIWNPNGQVDSGATDSPASNLKAETRPDGHLLNGPQIEAEASSQEDIDDVLADDIFDGFVGIEDEVEVIEPEPSQEPVEAGEPSPAVPKVTNPPRIDWSEGSAGVEEIAAPAQTYPEDLPDISASSGDTGGTTLEASGGVSDLSDNHTMALFS